MDTRSIFKKTSESSGRVLIFQSGRGSIATQFYKYQEGEGSTVVRPVDKTVIYTISMKIEVALTA